MSACAAVLLFQLLDFGYGRDQSIFALVGRTIRDGGLPYRDAWDFKPPGIYFLYALAGPATWGIRVLEALSMAAMAVAFVALSRCCSAGWGAGLVGAILALDTHVRLEFWHTAQPESFGAALVACGLAFAANALERGRRAPPPPVGWLWFGAGLSYGAAAMLKPTIGVAGAASVAALAVDTFRRYGRSSGRPLIACLVPFLVGGLLPLFACVGFFWIRGGMGAWRDAMAFIPQYSQLAWAHASGLDLFQALIVRWLTGYSIYIPIGLVLLVVFSRTGKTWSGVVHLCSAILLLLAGVLAQGKLFPYHFGAVLPLTALLAGWGFWEAWERSAAVANGRLLWCAIVVLLATMQPPSADLPGAFSERCALRFHAWSHPAEREKIRDQLYSVADFNAADNRRVADELSRTTATGSSIHVYGFSPGVYLDASRRQASRYIYNVPQRARWSRTSARSQLLTDLAESPPAAIVVEHGDRMPWVVGDGNDSATDLRTFPELSALLGSRYRLPTAVGKFDVYYRAD